MNYLKKIRQSVTSDFNNLLQTHFKKTIDLEGNIFPWPCLSTLILYSWKYTPAPLTIFYFTQ